MERKRHLNIGDYTPAELKEELKSRQAFRSTVVGKRFRHKYDCSVAEVIAMGDLFVEYKIIDLGNMNMEGHTKNDIVVFMQQTFKCMSEAWFDLYERA
jgi:phage FluMu gp28-like protein